MLLRSAILLVAGPVLACAQTPCPGVNFLTAMTVSLTPSSTSHTDVVRQSDGSYTGFEVSDTAPFGVIATTPHFEKQFATCLPHTIPASPTAPAPVANPVGAGSQTVVSTTFPSGNQFVANINSFGSAISFEVFDSGHNLVSQSGFAPPSSLSGINSLALADVNRDGNLDLVAVFYSGVWVFLGNGDGTFRPGKYQILSSVLNFYSGTVGDLNGDGIPDLVLATSGGSILPDPDTFAIALGKGDGTFSTPRSFQVPGLGDLTSAAIADLNGDGKADLVLSGYDPDQPGDNVAVALGNGNGTFQAISSYSALNTSSGVSPASVAVGDVNGDGFPDIVTTGSILFGDGKGGFPSRRDYTSNANGSVMLADFDGDGRMDIIIGDGNPNFLSTSGGNSWLLQRLCADLTIQSSLCGVIYPPTPPSLTVLFGAGAGAFVAAPATPVAGTYVSLAAADFNGDGIPDLAVASGSGAITILEGKGDGEFSSVFTQRVAEASQSSTFPPVTAADFNHDGKPDLAVLVPLAASQASEVRVFSGNGDGTLGAPFTVPIPDATTNFIAAPDVNGDGIPDLVVTSGSSVYVALSKGDGTFSAPMVVASGSHPAVAFADFNGDGKLDIGIVTAGSNSVAVLLGKGDGTFPKSVQSMLPGYALGGPNTTVVADFNGDGKLDLAVVTENSIAAVVFGQGSGGFSGYQLSAGPSIIFTADVNGDGMPDLVGPGPSVYLGNGDGTFQGGVTIQPASNSRSTSLAIADFNRDGMPDIAVPGASGVVAFLNLSRPSPPLTVVSAATFAIGPLAPDTFAAAFGQAMTGSDQPSAVGSLPGVSVAVEDSAGTSRTASLSFVSDGQINFLVPADTAIGFATVTVTTASGKQLSAQVRIAAIAPALFTVGANDAANFAAAYVVYVAPGGAQTVEPLFIPANPWEAPVSIPINVSRPGETYLVLFGTGFDAASAAATVTTVQGVGEQVSYAGVQPTYAGLDQINLLLSPSLAGAGEVSVSVSIGAQTANTVLVTIQ